MNSLIKTCEKRITKLKKWYKGKAFTLVELIIVVTILAILWTISFIYIQWYTQDTRDVKRLSDIKSLISKITIENTKWTSYSDLIDVSKWQENKWLQILGKTWEWSDQWPVNFANLKEPRENFLDPLTKDDYIFWYTYWWENSERYAFVQWLWRSEKINDIILWNYYQSTTDDEEWIIFPVWCKTGREGGCIPFVNWETWWNIGGDNVAGNNNCIFWWDSILWWEFWTCIFG
jgi:prepilin-type N-terminal cleavage/methylation domain-containing protein